MNTCQSFPASKGLRAFLALALWLAFAAAGMAQAPAPGGAPGVYPYPTSPGANGPAGSTSGYGGGNANNYNAGEFSFDQPTAFQSMPDPMEAHRSTAARACEAICWYVPNRLMDLTDIVRFHFAMGDGMGASVRATKFLCGSWFQDSSFCLGWTKRTPPWFGEQIEERYFGFLAASEGELDRDPTEIGVSLHFMIAGFNLAASAGEALDALLGFAGVDLMGDDHGPMMFYDKPLMTPAQKANQLTVHGQENAQSKSEQQTWTRAKGWKEDAPVPQQKPFADPGKKIEPPVPAVKK